MKDWEVRPPETHDHEVTKCDDEATKCLEEFLTASTSPNLVSILRTEEPVDESLETLLKMLLLRGSSLSARVCLLISPEAKGPTTISNAAVYHFDGSSLPRAEIEEYLRSRRGYNSQEIGDFFDKMLKLELTEHPALVYGYIETHCTHRWES